MEVDMEIEELTDDQKYNNYCRLLNAVNYIEEGQRITEDWMEEQKNIIHQIKSAFQSGFRNINPEIKDKEFRNLAVQAETLSNSLYNSVEYDKTFKVGHYHLFLTKILAMLDIVCKYYGEEEELSTFMNKMTLG
jgi:hypothetical protein